MPDSVVTEVQKPAEGQSPQPAERAPGEKPQSMREDWAEFKGRVKTESSEGVQGVLRPARNDIDLKELTPEQQEHWQKTGELPEPKEGTEKSAETKPGAEGDARQTVKGEAKQRQNQQQQTPYDHLLERASKEPEFEKIVERLNEPFFPLSAEGSARYQVLGHALSQVSNAHDVLYFLSHPENSSVALKMQDAPPHKIAQTVHMISAELRFGGRTAKRAEEPRPRAPKPPSEVGGRASAPIDAEWDAVQRNDFRGAEAIWNQRLKQGRG